MLDVLYLKVDLPGECNYLIKLDLMDVEEEGCPMASAQSLQVHISPLSLYVTKEYLRIYNLAEKKNLG